MVCSMNGMRIPTGDSMNREVRATTCNSYDLISKCSSLITLTFYDCFPARLMCRVKHAFHPWHLPNRNAQQEPHLLWTCFTNILSSSIQDSSDWLCNSNSTTAPVWQICRLQMNRATCIKSLKKHSGHVNRFSARLPKCWRYRSSPLI